MPVKRRIPYRRRARRPLRQKYTSHVRRRNPYAKQLAHSIGIRGNMVTNTVFPTSLPVKLYAAMNDVALTTTAGEMVSASILCNSLNDPFNTLGADKARWTNTLLGADGGAAPYSRYLVHAAKISVTFYPCAVSPSATGYFRVGLAPRLPNSTAPSSISELQIRGGAKTRSMVTGYGQKPVVLHHYVPVKKWWDRTNLKDSASIFGAAYNANPTNLVYLDICAGPTAESGANGVYYDIKVKFYATLYSINDVADS